MAKKTSKNLDKKELIITIIVLASSVMLGFMIGKTMFESLL